MANKKKVNLKTYYREHTKFKPGDFVVWYYDEDNNGKKDFNFERVVKLKQNDRTILEHCLDVFPIFTEVLYTQCKFTKLYDRGWIEQDALRLATPTEIALYGKK